jgi:hypothetical protein
MKYIHLILVVISFIFLTGFKFILKNHEVQESAQFILIDQVPSWQKEQLHAIASGERIA